MQSDFTNGFPAKTKTKTKKWKKKRYKYDCLIESLNEL